MTFSTDVRVPSRTLGAPLMTRETVPTPTPEAAATSAIVARRGDGIVTLPKRAVGTGSTELDHRRAALPRRQEPDLSGSRAGMRWLGARDIRVIVHAPCSSTQRSIS